AGSGDISVASTRTADLAIPGSGDVRIGRVDGVTLEVSIAESGAIRVGGGLARTLGVSTAASATVTFGGRAGVVNASSRGRGRLRVAEATGAVNRRVAGAGEIRIGNQWRRPGEHMGEASRGRREAFLFPGRNRLTKAESIVISPHSCW